MENKKLWQDMIIKEGVVSRINKALEELNELIEAITNTEVIDNCLVLSGTLTADAVVD